MHFHQLLRTELSAQRSRTLAVRGEAAGRHCRDLLGRGKTQTPRDSSQSRPQNSKVSNAQDRERVHARSRKQLTKKLLESYRFQWLVVFTQFVEWFREMLQQTTVTPRSGTTFHRATNVVLPAGKDAHLENGIVAQVSKQLQIRLRKFLYYPVIPTTQPKFRRS